MLENITPRKIVYGFALLVFVLLLITGLILIPRIGKTRVTVEVIPKDSQVSFNNQPGSVGDNYIKPGKYTVKAHRSGFSDDQVTVGIGSDVTSIYLVPKPSSAEATKWLKDNPEIALQREGIAGKRTDAEGRALQDNNPIIKMLPVTKVKDGPFSIDYGIRPDKNNKVYIEISDSSPSGRENALKWIRDHGFDPTDLKVVFDDYKNPLVASGSTISNGDGGQ